MEAQRQSSFIILAVTINTENMCKLIINDTENLISSLQSIEPSQSIYSKVFCTLLFQVTVLFAMSVN